MKAISPEVLRILEHHTMIDGNKLTLTSGQLDRKLYVAVNDLLEALGGTWNRRARAHVFEEDPSAALDQVLLDGCYSDRKRDFQQFFTPRELAEEMAAWADVEGESVLEPSAGDGALVRALLPHKPRHIRCVEKDPRLRAVLRLIEATVPGVVGVMDEDDFLAIPYGTIAPTVAVLNPPFTRCQDAMHILHAMKCLAKGGRLVAIGSAALEWRETKVHLQLREQVYKWGGTIERLPSGTFRSSGTDVETVIVKAVKP